MSNEGSLSLKYRIRIIYFYCLIISLLLGWGSLSLAFAYWIISLGNENYSLLIVAVFLVFYALFSVIVSFGYKPHKSRGISVTKDKAPQLFALITDVANRIKYKGKIEEIILTPGMSVSVNYNPTLSNFIFNSKAKLYIGVLVCRVLSTDEISAVIAHELAHFSQSETKYKAYLARIANISSKLGKNGGFHLKEDISSIFGLYAWPARFLSYIFRHLFEAIFDKNSSDYIDITADMELEADKISSQAIGPSNMLSALCKSYAVSNRLAIYKLLILPYLSSHGYRCNGFWSTFKSSCPLFEKIDNLDIRTEELLLDLKQTKFDISECILALRLDLLQQISDKDIAHSTMEATIDMIPTSIQNEMDYFLCCKYGQTSGIPIGSIKLNEILDGLSNGLFNEVHSMSEAFLLLDDLLSNVRADKDVVTPMFMPEYACQSYDVLPNPIIKQATEEIYSSAIDICPVCGREINEDTKVCPHCHEIISE